MRKSIIALLFISIIVSLFFVGCNNTSEASTPDEIKTTAPHTTITETISTTNASTTSTTETTAATVSTTVAETTTQPAIKETEAEVEIDDYDNNEYIGNDYETEDNYENENNNDTDSDTENDYVEPDVITYDTPLTYEQISKPEYMQMICDKCIDYFSGKGMTYTTYTMGDSVLNPDDGVWYWDESISVPFDKDHRGWFFVYQGANNRYDVRSVNEQIERSFDYIVSQVEGILIQEKGYTYGSYMNFNVYYEQQSDGGYNIYFCYG